MSGRVEVVVRVESQSRRRRRLGGDVGGIFLFYNFLETDVRGDVYVGRNVFLLSFVSVVRRE